MLWATGFLVHEFGQFHAEHKIGPNTWPHFYLLWIYSGRVTIQLGRKEPLELNGGDGVLIYPNTPFQWKALTDTAFASAQHFDFDRSKELPPTLQRLRAKKGGYRVYRGFSHNPVVADIERAIHLASKPQNKAMRELRWLNLAMILNQLESTSVVDQAAPEGREKLTAWRQAFRKTPLLKATVSDCERIGGTARSHFAGAASLSTPTRDDAAPFLTRDPHATCAPSAFRHSTADQGDRGGMWLRGCRGVSSCVYGLLF